MKVELHHITKRFSQVLANDRISLTVEAGSIHGLLGENGAGKSTLVKILSGFIAPDTGEIWIDGQPVKYRTPAGAIAAGVGMLHQDPLDFPPLDVLDNFIAGKTGRWLLDRQAAKREFLQLAAQFNFQLDIHEPVANLTVGERQQLEILRLLSLGVNTLILDEPTTGISASQKHALFEALKVLAQQGKSIIFVSHKLEDVEILCDRVTVMKQGQVVGREPIPCPAAKLVAMMFDRELAPPVKPPTVRAEPMLELQGIVLNGDRLTVAIDQLSVQKGEVIGLAGLEGSGQRLLLLCCAGLLAPQSGKILLDSQDITQASYKDYLNIGIGYSPADRLREGLIGGLSIQDHFTLRQPQKSFFIDRKTIAKATQEAIALFNIKGRPQTPVERLSGGNQQRTQLALLPVPLNLLLMEHPTRGLDIESALWVWEQLIARCEGGTSILFASSDLDEIMQYSDRILVFSGGQVSPPIPTSQLTVEQLGQAIGGKFTPLQPQT
ncbi:MAG: ATP-binding cassette domain-containing protein [Desertifilum sp.]|nr:ATP-binding cassette domain-containing protein [Desertifilum sp.]